MWRLLPATLVFLVQGIGESKAGHPVTFTEPVRCPLDWKLFEGNCFRSVADAMKSYADSVEECRRLGGRLISFENVGGLSLFKKKPYRIDLHAEDAINWLDQYGNVVQAAKWVMPWPMPETSMMVRPNKNQDLFPPWRQAKRVPAGAKKLFVCERQVCQYHHFGPASPWCYQDRDDTGCTTPQFWPDLMCQCGYQQSPIDIVTGNAEIEYSLGTLQFSARYSEEVPGTLSNDGDSFVFKADDASGLTLTNGPMLNGETFEFVELRGHWGADDSQGSEHTVDGQRFPLELQMVHVNTKYPNVDTAIFNPDGVVIISVLFYIGSENADLQSAVIDHIGSITDPMISTTPSAATLMNLMAQFPDVMFYVYKGSATTPNCQEGVTWFVLQNRLQVSTGQLDALRTLVDKFRQPMQNNFRPVQPLNGRKVRWNGIIVDPAPPADF